MTQAKTTRASRRREAKSDKQDENNKGAGTLIVEGSSRPVEGPEDSPQDSQPSQALATNGDKPEDSIVVLNPIRPTIAEGRKICVSGFAEATRDQANKLDKSYQIWALNRCYTFLKRWDRWFEVHEKELYTGKTGLREAGYMEIIKKSKVPVYMMHPDESMGQAVQYPFAEICHYYGCLVNSGSGDESFEYYTTSIAYMLALALYEHQALDQPVQEIFICGVDMSAFSEYSEQLPCVSFWLGAIMGAGIKVTVPTGSPLLKSAASYGRHAERQLWAMVKERIEMYQQKQSQGQSNLAALEGADSEYNFVLETLEGRVKKWESAKTQNKPDDSGDEFFGVVETKEDGTVTWEELSDTITEIKQTIEHFKNRKKDISKFHAQVNADLNSTLGGYRECQHMLTAVNAPQTMDQEPLPVKTVNI